MAAAAKSQSKPDKFVADFLRSDGTSDVIHRYSLPDYCHWTSGDSILRSDSILGHKFLFFRFSKNLDLTKCSEALKDCIDSRPEIRDQIERTHASLKFEKSGNIVEYIQFFGKATDYENSKAPIRADIKKMICAMPCVNCGTRNEIQCDHKNDLYNDPRVCRLDTQVLDDFQPLCRHCNCTKRQVKARMLKENKRFGAKHLGYSIDFIHGDDTLDVTNPLWYIGTYWGDCIAFKRALMPMSS